MSRLFRGFLGANLAALLAFAALTILAFTAGVQAADAATPGRSRATPGFPCQVNATYTLQEDAVAVRDRAQTTGSLVMARYHRGHRFRGCWQLYAGGTASACGYRNRMWVLVNHLGRPGYVYAFCMDRGVRD